MLLFVELEEDEEEVELEPPAPDTSCSDDSKEDPLDPVDGSGSAPI